MARRPSKKRPHNRPSTGRRVGRVIVGLTVTLVLLGAALVVVDLGLRDFGETRAEAEITRRVPGQAQADVTIGGFSVLQQVVQGSLDEVDATFSFAAPGLQRLADNAGYNGTVSIDDQIVLDTAVDVLGVTVPVTVSLEPQLIDTGHLQLTATEVTVGPDINIDLTQIDLAALGVRVCAASLMPESFELRNVTIDDGRIVFTARGEGVPTSLDALSKRGTCVEPEEPADESGTEATDAVGNTDATDAAATGTARTPLPNGAPTAA